MVHQIGSAQYHRSSAEDGLLIFAFCTVIIGVGLYAAWHLFHTQISAAAIILSHAQMRVIGAFTDQYATLDAQVLARDPASVTLPALGRLFHNVGRFFRIPAIVLLLVLAVWCLLRNAPGQFTRDLDLPALMRTQAETFRTAAPFVHRKLGLVKPADGRPRPADPALHVSEWIACFGRAADGAYSEHRAVAELKRQLGAEWTGVTGAKPHVRCLFAAFALHAARRRADAIALLGDLAQSLPDGRAEKPAGPDEPLAVSAEAVAKADGILADASLAGPCAKVAAQHAFTMPAMMSVLTYARVQAGVMAPAQFAFLKLIDRPLWYALHSLGFPAGQNRGEQPNPRTEALGARDHWVAECDASGPLSQPSLDRALGVIRNAAGQVRPRSSSESAS